MLQSNFISYYLYGILESWATYSKTSPVINPKISESALNCPSMKYSVTLTIRHKCKGQIYGNISIILNQWIYSWGRWTSYCNILQNFWLAKLLDAKIFKSLHNLIYDISNSTKQPENLWNDFKIIVLDDYRLRVHIRSCIMSIIYWLFNTQKLKSKHRKNMSYQLLHELLWCDEV